MTRSRTASGVFARELQASYEVVDVGLIKPLLSDENPGGERSSARCGTRNMRHGPAMTAAEFDYSWAVGEARARLAAETNAILIGGEMGIGNTTAASCLACLLAGFAPDEAVGRGAGLDEAGMQRKRAVVADVVARVRRKGIRGPMQLACEAGGFEIVALAGYYAEAAERGRTILLDGFISTAAVALAEAIRPGTLRRVIAGHCSAEKAHRQWLERLGLVPLLDLDCRLGEASGALLALPLIDLAAAMMNGMATLEELEMP
jgi:nicotinate-nucleotide--dimethylbenzimidazole phosphoribosyltransferase